MRTCIISSPVATQSGYGHHAREFITNAFKYKNNDWDIKISINAMGTYSIYVSIAN